MTRPASHLDIQERRHRNRDPRQSRQPDEHEQSPAARQRGDRRQRDRRADQGQRLPEHMLRMFLAGRLAIGLVDLPLEILGLVRNVLLARVVLVDLLAEARLLFRAGQLGRDFHHVPLVRLRLVEVPLIAGLALQQDGVVLVHQCLGLQHAFLVVQQAGQRGEDGGEDRHPAGERIARAGGVFDGVIVGSVFVRHGESRYVGVSVESIAPPGRARVLGPAIMAGSRGGPHIDSPVHECIDSSTEFKRKIRAGLAARLPLHWRGWYQAGQENAHVSGM
ncbi:hypothetical protein BGLA2_510020 [Burkholderia gladioli]|nr:hypothetical protein BGLA2_510020 [Burkholderia gladioli]